MSPERDLTPAEINDPQMMQLWLAPYGSALPRAWDDTVGMEFRFAGMVRRDVRGRFVEREPVRLNALSRETGPPVLKLTWHRLLDRHAAVMPIGTYCSLLLGLPAERQLGVVPKAALQDFSYNLRGSGASCDAIVEPAESGSWMTWFVAPPLMAVA